MMRFLSVLIILTCLIVGDSASANESARERVRDWEVTPVGETIVLFENPQKKLTALFTVEPTKLQPGEVSKYISSPNFLQDVRNSRRKVLFEETETDGSVASSRRKLGSQLIGVVESDFKVGDRSVLMSERIWVRDGLMFHFLVSSQGVLTPSSQSHDAIFDEFKADFGLAKQDQASLFDLFVGRAEAQEAVRPSNGRRGQTGNSGGGRPRPPPLPASCADRSEILGIDRNKLRPGGPALHPSFSLANCSEGARRAVSQLKSAIVATWTELERQTQLQIEQMKCNRLAPQPRRRNRNEGFWRGLVRSWESSQQAQIYSNCLEAAGTSAAVGMVVRPIAGAAQAVATYVSNGGPERTARRFYDFLKAGGQPHEYVLRYLSNKVTGFTCLTNAEQTRQVCLALTNVGVEVAAAAATFGAGAVAQRAVRISRALATKLDEGVRALDGPGAARRNSVRTPQPAPRNGDLRGPPAAVRPQPARRQAATPVRRSSETVAPRTQVAPRSETQVAPRVPAAQRALTDVDRGVARESLEAKGIRDSNIESFFDETNPIQLSDRERVYLFERYSGQRLTDGEVEELLRLHNVGEGFGSYTFSNIREKAAGLRELLQRKGITDPETLRRIVGLTLRNGVAGNVREITERRTALQRIQDAIADLFGRGPRAQQAAVDARFAAQIADAPNTFRQTRREVLDPNRESSRGSLGRTLSGNDTFGNNFQYRGTMDDLITSRTYANDGFYEAGGGRRLWWRETSISGRESGSPIGSIVDDVSQVERRFNWQNDQNVGRAATTYDTDFTKLGIVDNIVKGVVHSTEAIVRKPDGSIDFLYYVREGDKMVPATTFKGEAIPGACIKCHQHPSNPGVATQLPYMALQQRGLDGYPRGYADAAAQIAEREGFPPVIPDRMGRPGTVAPRIRERPAASRAELRDDAQRARAAQTARRTGADLDRRRTEIERIVGPIRSGSPQSRAISNATDMQFRRAGRTDGQLRGEQYSILRYNMTIDEVRAFRANPSNGGRNPPEVYTADQADRIMREGVFGELPPAPTRNAPRVETPDSPTTPEVTPTSNVTPQSVTPTSVRTPPVDTRTLGTSMRTTDEFVFYDKNSGRVELGPDTLVPGRSYTTVERNGKIVIGDNFADPVTGGTAGTHPELGKFVARDMPTTIKPGEAIYRGGAIRVNADGSVDVSGYHLQCVQPRACRAAADALKDAFERAGIRVRVSTPDRLPPPGGMPE